MQHLKTSRRRFISRTGMIAAGLDALDKGAPNAMSAPVDWSIGCFNRPWGKWSYDEALDELKSAGFKTTGIVGRHKTQPESLLTPDASADYLAQAKRREPAQPVQHDCSNYWAPRHLQPPADSVPPPTRPGS